jgi:hypothetical protein
MQTTRRTFLGSVGAAAALGVTGGMRIPEPITTPFGAADVPVPSTEKVLFWVALRRLAAKISSLTKSSIKICLPI